MLREAKFAIRSALVPPSSPNQSFFTWVESTYAWNNSSRDVCGAAAPHADSGTATRATTADGRERPRACSHHALPLSRV
ncbi:predicted protein [Streptomyces sviceus ATCC 29083]|uniref:Transposase n=1 Tax=Streptomyces sviceus (strain ATCC 29083 / DSM 924 / JCM 4929 / NBRC 13980 / NCIMB 11184 / NRRL 5439 / UC 5370) TaxID=463191 RepID=D6XCU9_STRX2|nr:predicted protein [Streptomyces sviceus ATCC 29083]